MASAAWSVLMLVVVLALIAPCLWLLKRLQTLQSPGGARALETVAQLSLGGRERVIAVRAGARVLVLGVTADNVNLLVELPEGEIALPQGPVGRADFGALLQAITRRAGTERKQ